MALEKKKAVSNKKTPKATTNKKQTAAAKKKLSMSRGKLYKKNSQFSYKRI